MKNKVNQIYNSNNLDYLKTLEDNCIDTILTDVPYGLQDVNALKMIKEGVNNTSGFMNKSWDVLPSVEMLKEFYRVLKTGAYFVTTFTPRQDLQAILFYRLLEAGFDINFSPIYWCYASGFPKASNYAIAIDKHFNAEREVVGYTTQGTKSIFDGGKERKSTISSTIPAKYCDGIYSLGLKPAVEPIIIAQKPHNKAKYKQALDWYNERQELLEKGVKEEELCFYTKNASGGVRMNDCRIAIEENDMQEMVKKGESFVEASKKDTNSIFFNFGLPTKFERNTKPHNQGRFPANLLVSDNAVDVNRITKSSDALRNNQGNNFFKFDKNTTSGHNDEGDLSRYFSLDNWTKKHYPELYKLSQKTLELEKDAKKISPCLFTPKPSVAEKNMGLEKFGLKEVEYEKEERNQAGFNYEALPRQNTHPTSKCLSLYNYLIHLFSNENDIILDPFSGSGTTCISAVLTNRYYIGIDITEEYCNIARARVEYWKKAKETKLNNQLL